MAPHFFFTVIELQWHMGARFVAYVVLFSENLGIFEIRSQSQVMAPRRGGGHPPLGGKKWSKFFFQFS